MVVRRGSKRYFSLRSIDSESGFIWQSFGSQLSNVVRWFRGTKCLSNRGTSAHPPWLAAGRVKNARHAVSGKPCDTSVDSEKLRHFSHLFWPSVSIAFAGKHFYVQRETGTIQRVPADIFHPKARPGKFNSFGSRCEKSETWAGEELDHSRGQANCRGASAFHDFHCGEMCTCTWCIFRNLQGYFRRIPRPNYSYEFSGQPQWQRAWLAGIGISIWWRWKSKEGLCTFGDRYCLSMCQDNIFCTSALKRLRDRTVETW